MNAPLASSDTHEAVVAPTVGGLRLRLFVDMEAVKPIWVALETTAVCTAYQSFVWCRSWMQRVGRKRGILPVILVAEDGFGTPMFVLPLQRRCKLGAVIVEAMTAPQGAYAFGLFNPNFTEVQAQVWFQNHFPALVAALPKHDILHLADLPSCIANYRNPLLAARHFLAANQSHIMALRPDYQALLEAKRAAESRRSIRKRDAKLAATGKLVFDLPLSLRERKTTVETMLAQQKVRLAEMGVHDVFDELEQQFITDLVHSQTPEGPFLRPYRLILDGNILAVMLGAYRHGTYWALISSLTTGDIRKHSPGDFALRAMIQSLCEDGTRCLDFSAGDTAYKSHWADQIIPLYFIVRTSTFKGLPLAVFILLREKLKGLAKRTPVLNAMLFKLRRILRGRKIVA
jgi:CelD/BcsL family acetyltransferase involved in cellulose biosynthesis